MNNVQLMGRLTKDVELRYIPNNGMAVARFTVAVNRIGKKDEADFIPVTAFGKTAEVIAEHFKKGHRILITDGRINTSSYKNSEDKTVYKTDIIAERIGFVEPKEK